MKDELKDGLLIGMSRSSLLLFLGLLLTALLLYATFIPLNYTPLTWSESRERWKFIPWLNLGLYSRADWIANCLVVMPCSFLLAGGLDLGLRSRVSWFLVFPIITFWLACIVVGMEFAQVWFPPRTVSQNDIAAGLVGILAGAWVWLLLGRTAMALLSGLNETHSRNERLSLLAFLAGCGCFIYAVLPMDLVLSSAEWGQKIRMGRLSFFPSYNDFFAISFYKGLLIAFLQSFPWGIYFGARTTRRGSVLAWVILISLILECIQIPIYTKHTSILDLVLSVVGGISSYSVARWLVSKRLVMDPSSSKWLAFFVAFAWALCLILGNTLRFDHIEKDPVMLSNRATDFFQYPFLRYYYTSEFSALSSILGKLIGFGILGGLWVYSKSRPVPTGSVPMGAALVAGGLCLVLAAIIEGLQVFLPPLLPDINDLFLAFVGGTLGAWLVNFLIAVPWRSQDTDPSEDMLGAPESSFDFSGVIKDLFSYGTIGSVTAWTALSLVIVWYVSQFWMPAWGLLDELAGWMPANVRYGKNHLSAEEYYRMALDHPGMDQRRPDTGGRKKLLELDEFEYLGSFRVAASFPNQASVSNSSGGMAIRYIDGQLHFILTSHYARGGLMYECKFPGLSTRWPYPQARIVAELGDVYQSQKWLQPVRGKVINELSADVATGGLYYDDPSETLYWTYGHFFNTENPMDNSFGTSRWNVRKGRFEAVGSWGIENIPEKFRRGGFIEIPEWFRAEFLKGDYLGIGHGGYYSIVASASFGPSLSVFDKKNLHKYRSHSDIPGKMLLGYPINSNARCWRTDDYRSEFDGGKWNPDGERGHWAWTDGVNSAVWLDFPKHHGLFFFARLGTGRVWYEDSTLHAQGAKLVWIQYDPNDLVDVLSGKKKPWEIQPDSMWDAPVQSDEPIAKWEREHGYDGTSLASISGAAFDRKTNTLFLLSNAGYRTGLFEWAPQIHAFKVAPKS
jgi:VanZ family protein